MISLINKIYQKCVYDSGLLDVDQMVPATHAAPVKSRIKNPLSEVDPFHTGPTSPTRGPFLVIFVFQEDHPLGLRPFQGHAATVGRFEGYPMSH